MTDDRDPILTPTWTIEERQGKTWTEIDLFVGKFELGFEIMRRDHAGKDVRFKPVAGPYPIGYSAFSLNRELDNERQPIRRRKNHGRYSRP